MQHAYNAAHLGCRATLCSAAAEPTACTAALCAAACTNSRMLLGFKVPGSLAASVVGAAWVSRPVWKIACINSLFKVCWLIMRSISDTKGHL